MASILARTSPPSTGGSRIFRILTGALVLAGLACGLWFAIRLWGPAIDWNRGFLDLMGWLRSRGIAAAFWVIGLQALLVVLAIPGPFFTVGAGFLFGTALGSVVAICGSALGATAAYWIARRIAGNFPEARIAAWCARSPRLRILERFIMSGGWRVVLSTRLIPFFPFKLSNYLFGWTRFPFAHFFWGTVIGIAPITVVSVSAGALASDLTALLHPEAAAGNAWLWSLASLVIAAAVLAYAGYRARAEWRRRIPDADSDGGGAPP